MVEDLIHFRVITLASLSDLVDLVEPGTNILGSEQGVGVGAES